MKNKTFALELGSNSAEILNELASGSIALSESIRSLNRKYGKKLASKTPLVFGNRKSDIFHLVRSGRQGDGQCYRFRLEYGLHMDGAIKGNDQVDNFFECLDYLFDDSNDETGGVNKYKW